MIVVKIGGGAGVNTDAICADIAGRVAHSEQHKSLEPLVIVHGTSDAVNTLSERIGLPPRTLQSPSGHVSRYTDPETLDVYTMAAAGQMNKTLVAKLQRLGVNAVGLSGVDGKLMQAQRKDAVRAIDPATGRQRVIRDDFTGRVDQVNADLLRLLLNAGYTPVIAPLAIGAECERLNVDGDRASAQVAGALGAATLVILSNVPGLLANFPDETSLIRHLHKGDMARAMDIAGGRMKKKVLAAQEALDLGVARIVLADSRQPTPISAAIAGEGTVITP